MLVGASIFLIVKSVWVETPNCGPLLTVPSPFPYLRTMSFISTLLTSPEDAVLPYIYMYVYEEV